MTTERMKRRNLFVRMVLILLILAMPLTSCAQTEPTGQGTEESTEATGIMDGFTVGDGDESLCITCAYKSDKTVFDIDDVTLTFYYGGDFYDSLELELEKGYNIPWFELYFKDENGKKYFIRRVEENLVSEKYRMTYVRDQEKQHATRSY
ncbi:MAG: hypothetical protein IJW16_03295, partial [Clostridia bacterium]|nr:hypothetical protein [Clostridia bacterium]